MATRSSASTSAYMHNASQSIGCFALACKPALSVLSAYPFVRHIQVLLGDLGPDADSTLQIKAIYINNPIYSAVLKRVSPTRFPKLQGPASSEG